MTTRLKILTTSVGAFAGFQILPSFDPVTRNIIGDAGASALMAGPPPRAGWAV